MHAKTDCSDHSEKRFMNVYENILESEMCFNALVLMQAQYKFGTEERKSYRRRESGYRVRFKELNTFKSKETNVAV